MSERSQRAHRVPINRQTLTQFIGMVRRLFSSEIGTPSIVMVAVLIALLLAINSLNVVNSYVGRYFMTAISQRDRAGFLWYAMAYTAVFAGSTVADVLYGFTVGRLGLLWRVTLTQRILGRYLNNRAYFRLTATDSVRIDGPSEISRGCRGVRPRLILSRYVESGVCPGYPHDSQL